jgi:deoxyribonuclease-4
MEKQARFGPAGNSDAFFESGCKSVAQAPEWLAALGLNAYEYQGGHGVRVSQSGAELLGGNAARYGIALSLHAPYYISLASDDPAKRDNSLRYILQSARAVSWMGGSRIVVHPGGLGGLPRGSAVSLAGETLLRAQELLDDEGLSEVRICPETMGKLNQLGDLDEVISLCLLDERFLPCVDFGHLNSRTTGGVNSRDRFAAVFDAIESKLGKERASMIHIHFSKIEYTAAGEKRHLTFEDKQFGPEPEPLMELIAERGWTPTVICESRGTQDSDAQILKLLHDGFRLVEEHK